MIELNYDKEISGIDETAGCYRDFDFSCYHFEDSSFTGIEFYNSDFSDSSFINVSFYNCNLSSCVFDLSLMNRVSFKDCILSGASFIEAKAKNVKIESSNMMYSTLDKLTGFGLDIHSSNLHGSSLRGLNLKNSRIVKSDMSSSNIQGTILSSLSLKDSDITGIFFSDLKEIKGAKLDVNQVMAIASVLGIQIIG